MPGAYDLSRPLIAKTSGQKIRELEKKIDLQDEVVGELLGRILKRLKRIEEVLVETGTVGDLCFTPYKENPS